MVVDALPFFAVLMDSSATADSVKPMAEMMRTKVASGYGKPADPAASRRTSNRSRSSPKASCG